ncbi:hypothetical protein I6J22_07830 [Corynebacterium kroppenstedtii]|uniref:Alkaline shock response membrane anchor protein AmaP n=1 Tax=Corynebacterium kroppenstedtii (strain DSM 44385 / JCM 11950 / CIP 105744 / CCUG 35717) TaxID=645127 RepID=C4LL59_CORK4|nr:DUF6286 domain-containing protein [Corynebacterium kroppenstedtii]ACR18564.1 hypothetical protein ckrop_1844 [Corynebacterium kroppenstedtii DSM 44385]QRP10115.1 hypothetical protein I6J22_07830 [Corynebacterium kroppenstedtii]HJD69039.1 DUF6286 domain-containing protein [Corynebacterium kroppenstedtii]
MAKHQLKPEHEPTPGNAQAGIGQSRADNPAGKAAKAANGKGATPGKTETKGDANKAEATSAGTKKADTNKAATTPDSRAQSATPSWKKLSFRPAKEPRKSPRARGWMFILGLVFLAGGAVGIRELLLETDTISGPSWLQPIIDWLSHAHWVQMFLIIAVIALILGLIILIASLRPRTKTHILIDNEASLWMRPVDIARACSARAKGQRGVLNATTVATAKRVTVTVTGDPDDPGLSDRVHKACRPVVQAVSSQPDLKVRLARPRSDQ